MDPYLEKDKKRYQLPIEDALYQLVSTHIRARNRAELEDRRYGALRKKEGERFWYSSLECPECGSWRAPFRNGDLSLSHPFEIPAQFSPGFPKSGKGEDSFFAIQRKDGRHMVG